MATPDEILTLLAQALLNLLQILDGRSHGIFRGTCEAALAEAQGAQIGPGGFNHLQSLRNTLSVVTTRQDALENAINRIASIDPGLSLRVRQMLSPLLNQSSQVVETLEETEQMAVDLGRTNPTRLSGVIFGQGGMGPEIARDSRALITTQMQQTASQLMGRGIEPRLIPDIQSGGTQLLDKIRQLPTTLDDCIRNLIATITAIRLAVQQAAVQAGRVGLAVLGDALLAIGEALAALGSRLVNMLLIINMDKMLEQIFPSRTVA
jgi:hypothetical protein